MSNLNRREFLIETGAAVAALTAVGGVASVGGCATANTDRINAVLQAAIDAGDVPGLTAAAATRNGVFYTGAFGTRGVDTDQAMTADSIFRIFSMSKAIGTTAAMQLVEQGKIGLDTRVEYILPHFRELQVLEGFDGDTPKLRAPNTKATIRHLGTHTSGLVYEFWNQDMAKYLTVTGRPGILSGTKEGLMYPLVFDPGTKWDYGIGIDWLGQVVEAVTGQRIDVYCRENILGPLGMDDTLFECEGACTNRIVTAHGRGEDGTLAPIEVNPPSHPVVYGMGHCLYSTAPDYMQFLLMMLNNGSWNGAQVLKPETVALMKENHIGDLLVNKLWTSAPGITNDAEFFPGMPKKHGMGFMINLEQWPGLRTAGSHAWAGAMNTYFWFDPNQGVAGTILTQLLPFADPQALAIFENFEKAVYASV